MHACTTVCYCLLLSVTGLREDLTVEQRHQSYPEVLAFLACFRRVLAAHAAAALPPPAHTAAYMKWVATDLLPAYETFSSVRSSPRLALSFLIAPRHVPSRTDTSRFSALWCCSAVLSLALYAVLTRRRARTLVRSVHGDGLGDAADRLRAGQGAARPRRPRPRRRRWRRAA